MCVSSFFLFSPIYSLPLSFPSLCSPLQGAAREPRIVALPPHGGPGAADRGAALAGALRPFPLLPFPWLFGAARCGLGLLGPGAAAVAGERCGQAPRPRGAHRPFRGDALLGARQGWGRRRSDHRVTADHRFFLFVLNIYLTYVFAFELLFRLFSFAAPMFLFFFFSFLFFFSLPDCFHPPEFYE